MSPGAPNDNLPALIGRLHQHGQVCPSAFMPDEMGGLLVVAAERGAAQFVDAREAERHASPRASSQNDAASGGNLTLLPTDATMFVATSPEDDNAPHAHFPLSSSSSSSSTLRR